jgi:hypothetical protein
MAERVKIEEKVDGSGLRPEPRGASGVRNGGLGLSRPSGLTVCFTLGLEGKLGKARGGNDRQSRGPAQYLLGQHMIQSIFPFFFPVFVWSGRVRHFARTTYYCTKI